MIHLEIIEYYLKELFSFSYVELILILVVFVFIRIIKIIIYGKKD